MNRKVLNKIRERRQKRARARIFGTAEKPRLAIFRSSRFIYGQLIDDEKGRTLAFASSRGLAAKDRNKSRQAEMAGTKLAEEAGHKGIKAAVLDRRAFRFHGRVAAFVKGAREGGMKI